MSAWNPFAHRHHYVPVAARPNYRKPAMALPFVGAQPEVVQAPTVDNGFDWGDAGIGAAGVLAIALLSLGGVAGARRVARHGHSVSPAS